MVAVASTWLNIAIKEDRPLNCIKNQLNHEVTSCTWNTPPGEALLSPLVQCGPKGLRFLQPVELRIPHAGSRDPREEWNVSLKTSNERGQWREIETAPNATTTTNNATNATNADHPPAVNEQTEQLNTTKKSRNFLSVFVDHF